jgi:hypothetical protein
MHRGSLFLELLLLLAQLMRLARGAVCCAGDNPGFGDVEGQWAIGMLVGSSPFHLAPPRDAFNSSFLCPRNPIISCKDLNPRERISFVADPFLYIPRNNGSNPPWYVFYEVKNWRSDLRRRRGQIGASISYDQVIYFECIKSLTQLHLTGKDLAILANCAVVMVASFVPLCIRV